MQKLLIVVDYQNDFVTGSLGFPRAVEIEGAVAEKIERYRKNGDCIIFTLDTHGKNYLETLEGRRLPVPHCVRSTDGWRLYGRVAGLWREGDLCFEKDTFGSQELFDYLRERGRLQPYESVELCGVVTDICVIANAVLAKTALPQTTISVDAGGVASNDERRGEAALEVMRSLQIEILNG